ncbi:DUF1214 domain-containing protein [Salaquimonas pukyongi]|uniref:DUF1214 domain-containing protein n=1 Tax=Salaquimonas pukyongi TaxID=2712698 RepID=UPI00096BABEE|nr:DUF1214 domain-containing protein [Salaquimonas pukyongi]
MRLIADTLIVVLIGLVLGGASAWYTINTGLAFGGIRSGPWVSWPFASGASVDPYTMAKTVRNGTIPLGAAEGLAFEAKTDSRGEPLQLACDYSVSGTTPPSKLWTLAAYAASGEQIKPDNGSRSSVHSGRLLRYTDGSFRILISQRPKAGNWLGTAGEGRFRLVLRVYDTPVTSTSGLVTPTMPNIIRGRCET